MRSCMRRPILMPMSVGNASLSDALGSLLSGILFSHARPMLRRHHKACVARFLIGQNHKLINRTIHFYPTQSDVIIRIYIMSVITDRKLLKRIFLDDHLKVSKRLEKISRVVDQKFLNV